MTRGLRGKLRCSGDRLLYFCLKLATPFSLADSSDTAHLLWPKIHFSRYLLLCSGNHHGMNLPQWYLAWLSLTQETLGWIYPSGIWLDFLWPRKHLKARTHGWRSRTTMKGIRIHDRLDLRQWREPVRQSTWVCVWYWAWNQHVVQVRSSKKLRTNKSPISSTIPNPDDASELQGKPGALPHGITHASGPRSGEARRGDGGSCATCQLGDNAHEQ